MEKRYHVVRMEGKNAKPILANSGKPVVYGYKDAVIVAEFFTKQAKIKHQLRPVQEDMEKNWRERERDRLDSGEYTPVIWHKARWVRKNKDCADHFVHVSKDDPTRIAFTETEEKGERDIQTRMSPSKYLSRFYDDVISEKIKRQWLAAYKKEYGSDCELKFTKDSAEIVEIYTDGPNSCMQGSKSVEAWGDGDFALAFLQKKDRVVARTICFPKNKVYVRIYGDEALMEEHLRDEGYKLGKRGDFAGAKMRKIKLPKPSWFHGNWEKDLCSYVIPAIDFGYTNIDANTDNNYLIFK